ncbi:hypothetical protein Halru_0008 [Halovivax ruber XH-70]|uniref:Uncharacterized protein n=1 Tax=Halovivax ruber (strain DSM 18193 / JCM 13892 / XH-70) TaxID=797302 RepID=L0I7A1_HALRX|nr:hypothetical protein [Halovivax ruber]AGB14663.1 hypothetical protein Halru_0008 [Halovivax ruber XH-70]
MFSERTLSPPVESAREAYAPELLVYDAAGDFETLPPAQAEELGLIVDALDPSHYPAEWIPPTGPDVLERYASTTFTIGMPGDGSVVWTRQTTPPIVLVKPRLEGSPEGFVDFLLAEAIVECSLDVPEHFLGFFESGYRDLDAAVDLGPAGTYQIAAALYDGWIGLHTREEFASWESDRSDLAGQWRDAGARLEGRVESLPGAVARGETSFADATELACSAIKHGLDLPKPFDALDTDAYRDHASAFAIEWADRTFAALSD